MAVKILFIDLHLLPKGVGRRGKSAPGSDCVAGSSRSRYVLGKAWLTVSTIADVLGSKYQFVSFKVQLIFTVRTVMLIVLQLVNYVSTQLQEPK